MGHLSLYRAFRPTSFDQLVRQEHVTTILKNQIETDAVGHAYLFCGPRGTGKTTVARIFARAVNCERPINGSPCGKCETCRALAEGGNLDVAEIDAASNNGVNEMRELRDKVQYPPVSGAYKVYIIDEVHMLTDSAFNALLKTLEEPPRHAIFILATTEPHKIPATILSRCMRLDFKLIPEEDLEAHLKRVLKSIGKEYEEEAVAAIARAGAGSDRDMLSIAEMCISYSERLTYEGVTAVLGTADFGQMCTLLQAILACDLSAAIADTEAILSEGKSVGVLLRDILRLLNQVSIAKTCKNAEKLLSVPKDIFQKIKNVADVADGHAILRATEILSATEMDLRFSASPRICLETAIVKAATPRADYNLDALLARVNELEKQLALLQQNGVPSPVSVKESVVLQSEQPVKIQEETPVSSYDFPTEEPVFDEASFADFSVEEPVVREKSQTEREKREEKPKESVPVVPVLREEMSAQAAFGKFMRTLRKTSRNGVLFTMCSDLEAEYEGDALVLYTDSDTVFRSLNREDHREMISTTFASIGIPDYVIKKRGKESEKDTAKRGIEKLKEDFSDYPIELK